MRIVKSCLFGLCGLLIANLLMLVGMGVYLARETRSLPAGETVGWDPVSYMHSWPFWTLSVTGFGIGFVWQFRRTAPVPK